MLNDFIFINIGRKKDFLCIFLNSKPFGQLKCEELWNIKCLPSFACFSEFDISLKLIVLNISRSFKSFSVGKRVHYIFIYFCFIFSTVANLNYGLMLFLHSCFIMSLNLVPFHSIKREKNSFFTYVIP